MTATNLNTPLTRRRFLLSAGALTLGTALPALSFAKAGGSSRLVVLILRGALDGLAAVPPYGDPDYAALRQDLAIGRPGTPQGALALDGTFGLHPSLTFLHECYGAGELIACHAIASPYRDRSHFDGQTVLENGLDVASGGADGWLNRAFSALPARVAAADRSRAWALAQNLPPGPSGRDDLPSVARMAARVMGSESGPEIAVLEAAGWDTHANQGAAEGVLADRLKGLDEAVRTLACGLGEIWASTALIIVTEFGRTAAMNGTRGTDHGTGTCCFLVGGAVRGGRVIADWPGLKRTQLLEARDLRPTRDLRSVFKSVLGEHFGIPRHKLDAAIFPGSRAVPPLAGLIRA